METIETKYFVETYNGFDGGYDLKEDTNDLRKAKELAEKYVASGYQSAAVGMRHSKYVFCAGNKLPFSAFRLGDIGVDMTLAEIKSALSA